MPEPDVPDAAARPVHDPRQQDDGDNAHHQPEEENDNPGYRVPANCSRSNHGPRLPGRAPCIPALKRSNAVSRTDPSLRPSARHDHLTIGLTNTEPTLRPPGHNHPTAGRPNVVIVFRLGRAFAAAEDIVLPWGRYVT